MKNLITYLKALWSSMVNSQKSDMRHDCRLTVGSPSGMDAKMKQKGKTSTSCLLLASYSPLTRLLQLRYAAMVLFILTIGVGNVWGETQSFDPSIDKGTITANGTSSGDSFTKYGFTISSSNGVLGNGSNYRVYQDGTFTISSTVGTITEIAFTFSGSYNGGLETSYTGLSTTSWSANATSQARITAITVTYTPSGGGGGGASAQTLPYEYGFENNNLASEGWTTSCEVSTNEDELGICTDAKKTDDYGFRFSSFSSASSYKQYLFSPELDTESKVNLSFYYRASSSSGTETFKVGYSTTNNSLSSFTFGEEISTNSTSWQEYNNTFPAGTKYIAIYYYSDYQYRLYIDDFVFTEATPATIVLSEAGAESTVSGTHYSGDSYTLPSTTEAVCGTKVLVGWSTVTVAETDTKPTSNFYEKGESVTLSAGENKFYAVFATSSGGGGGAAVNTTMWSEDFSTKVTYNSATVTYEYTNGNSVTKTYSDNYAGGTSPELLIGKSGGAWAITGIPVGGAATLTLSYRMNNTNISEATTSTANVSIGSRSGSNPYTQTITISGSVSTFDLTFANSASSNGRIDDISVKVATQAGSFSAYSTSCEACAADPTIGTAQLKGSFSLSSVGVTATGWEPGANCSWEDYGFVWGTGANPTVSDNKVPVGTSGSATTWDGALTGSFTVGNTYHYRAYGKNGKASATYYYSSDATFTPRSVTFNMNGHGDAPATQYVNNGSKAEQPADPSAAGYIFGGWYKEAGCTNAWNFSSDVVSGANKTIYAKWYTVTVQKQDETGATIADAGVTATFGAASALAASAGSTNYVFKGWKFSGSSNGTSIASATSASTTLTGTPTGDVIVIAEFYKPITVTWLVGTTPAAGGTTEVKRGEKITELPSAPAASTLGATCSSLVFQGWSTNNLGAASGQSAPSDLFTSTSDAGVTALTGNTTYRAVFAEGSGGGGTSWTQTTSVSVGDVVVIAEIDNVSGDATGNELSGFSSTSTVYGTYDDFTTTPAGTKEWTVVTGYNSNGVAFKNGDNYLYWVTGNSLNETSSLSANSSWTITTESSRAKIVNNSTSTRIICWNEANPRFACYDNKKHGDPTSSGASTYFYYPIFYKKGSSVSYSNYVTSCDPNQVTVRYDGNGGSTTCASATYDKTSHQSHTVCSATPTHPESHHVFVKWCVNVDGSGAEYYPGDVITDVQEDITLYAMWRIECEKLATPTNISKTVTTHSISLTWDAVPNATGYEIVIRDEDKGTQHKKTTNTNPAFSTSTLEDAHNYSYKITAKGDGGTYYCDSDPAGPTAFSTPEATKYTVTFKPGSGTCATASLVTDQIKSMPIATSKCEGWTFVGWSTTKASTNPEDPTTSRPALITASSLSPYEPTSDVTLYAVYEGTSSTGGDYVLVESDLGSDWSGKYCIGYDATTFMDGALAGGTDAGHIGGANEAANPGANLSSKTIAKAWGDAHCLTLQKNGDVYTLQTLTGSYIYRIGTKNGMNSSSVVADATTNGLTVEWVDAAEDYLEIASSGGPTLQYSTNTTNGYFRYYASEQNTLKFYKQAGGGKAYVHDAGCVECEDATATFERPALTLTLEGTSSSILAAPNTYTSTNTSAKTYSSSNTSVATVNASTGALTLVGAGETIIKVTQPRSGNETDGFICPASAQYTLTVKAPTVDIVGIADDGNGIVIEHDLDGGVIHIDELVPVTEGETATELFFSKYYEAANNVKMVAIFNGTDHAISLEDIRIRILGDYPQSFMVREVFESLPEQLDANKEVVLLAWQKSDGKDLAIIGCADDNSKWSDWYKYAYSWGSDNGHTLAFGGKAAIILERVNEETGTAEMLDLIGAINNDGTINTMAVSKPSWGDSQGWNGTGLKIGKEAGDADCEIALSTNRCLLLRDKKVTSGKHAVEANTGSGNFVTLGKHLVDGKYVYEWHGDTIHVGDKSSYSTTDPKSDVYSSCNGFQQIAEYDYRNYYVDEQSRDAVYTSRDNGDGTQTIDFDKGTDLSTYSCKIFNIQVKKGDEVRLEQTYKVPIIVSGDKSTDDNIFKKFTSAQCADCDVVVLGSGSLSKLNGTSEDDRPTVRNLEVYAGAKMSVPAGKTYSVQSLRMRGTNQSLPEVKLAASATLTNRSGNVWYDRRIDEDHWYWLTLPYDVNTTDITFVDGTPAVLNSDYFIQYYDGAKRATTQTGGNWIEISGDRPLRAGEGYLIGVTPRHGHDFMELRFPMAGVVEAEFSNKDVPVDGNTVKDGIRANHVGWNLIGNPFMAGFKKGQMPTSGLTTGKLVKVMEGGKWTGLWESNADGTPYVTMRSDIDGNDYYQDMVSNVDLNAFDCFFIQLGDKDANAMSFPTAQRNLKPAYMLDAEDDKPFRTGVRLTGAGSTDHTGLLIGEGYTPAYEYNADLFKEFGSVYSLKAYTIQSDGLPLAYNAMAPESTENIPLGYRAPQKGSYVFKLDDSYSIDRIEALYLTDHVLNTTVNLLNTDYSFETERTQNNSRFTLSVVAKKPGTATGLGNTDADGKYYLTAVGHTLVLSGLDETADIYVYDISGRLIRSEKSYNGGAIWRTEVPATGVYFVGISSLNGEQTLRTIVK